MTIYVVSAYGGPIMAFMNETLATQYRDDMTRIAIDFQTKSPYTIDKVYLNTEEKS